MAMTETSKSRKGIYLLPNLLTTGALFAGFYAIVSANLERFEQAAVAVFYCYGARWIGWSRCKTDQYDQ